MKIAFLHKTCFMAIAFMASALFLQAQNGIQVRAKVFLSAALESNGLMRDRLREKGLLPSLEPYTNLPNYHHFGEGGGETITDPAVFQLTGPNAIVDWVVLEIRASNSAVEPISTHAALLQRDGDVVATDGVSPVSFLTVAPGQYYLAVRHRNHLGVMTANPIDFSGSPANVDFSSPSLPLFGTNACANNGTTRALWLGDSNRDKKAILQGPNNDIFYLFSAVLGNPGNINNNANYIMEGYNQTDYNLDGASIYSGPNNDVSIVFLQIGLNCNALNCILSEQVP